MKPYAIILGAAALMATTQLHAQQPTEPTETVTRRPGGATVTQTTKLNADIVSINPATRELVLKQPNGKTHELMASEEVRNFDQLRVGDKVTAEYTQALALDLQKGSAGIREGSESQSAGRSKPGEKPGGAAQREMTVLADVTAVDKKAQTVDLRGPRGNTVSLKVDDPEQLKNVKKGDQVRAVYTEALAVNVERAMSSHGASTPGATDSSGASGSANAPSRPGN